MPERLNDDFGLTQNFFDSVLAIYPRRTCDALAMATLQQTPWKENRFPRGISLDELQKWIHPLVKEEEAKILSGNPCQKIKN